MRLVVFAYHTVGVNCLKALLKRGAEIALVVTHQDEPGEQIWFPSVRALCVRKGLPVVTPENPNESAFVEQIRKLAPDAIFSFYYRKILCQGILDSAAEGAFNLHGSLLPKYRGRCPVNWVLIHGEKETGVTLHEMVRKADAGDIVVQKKVPIEEKDTALTLFDKIARAGAKAVNDFYPRLAKGVYERTPQDASQATVFGGRTPRDGLFSWDMEARSIVNMVRALTHPYPGAFVPFAGKDLWVWRARALTGINGSKPAGTVLSIERGKGVVVASRKGAVLLERVQWCADKETRADVFAKEKKIGVGAKLL